MKIPRARKAAQCSAALLFCLGSALASAATIDRTLSPRTITTQDRSGALILWDATPYVDRFSQQGTPIKEALKTLEDEAVVLFIRAAPSCSQSHLRVIVSYVQTGATEARYQTKSFEGVKTILTVDGAISRRIRFPKHWQADLQRGIVPAGIKVEVTRDLPSTER